jgi:hypothetical protein
MDADEEFSSGGPHPKFLFTVASGQEMPCMQTILPDPQPSERGFFWA